MDDTDPSERDALDLHGAEDDTEFATLASGSSLEEAKRKAIEQLRKLVPTVRETDIEYIVVDESSRGGFLGRRSVTQVEARLRPREQQTVAEGQPEGQSAAAELRAFLQKALALMGLQADVTVTESDDTIQAEVSGDDLGLLIGRHGQTIDALQYLSAIVVNRAHHTRRQVVLDAEGYRARRASSLHALADRMAQKAAQERASVTLKPMTAAERKVIHLHLKEDPRVETLSEGQEPHRAVVISPRRRS